MMVPVCLTVGVRGSFVCTVWLLHLWLQHSSLNSSLLASVKEVACSDQDSVPTLSLLYDDLEHDNYSCLFNFHCMLLSVLNLCLHTSSTPFSVFTKASHYFFFFFTILSLMRAYYCSQWGSIFPLSFSFLFSMMHMLWNSLIMNYDWGIVTYTNTQKWSGFEVFFDKEPSSTERLWCSLIISLIHTFLPYDPCLYPHVSYHINKC